MTRFSPGFNHSRAVRCVYTDKRRSDCFLGRLTFANRSPLKLEAESIDLREGKKNRARDNGPRNDDDESPLVESNAERDEKFMGRGGKKKNREEEIFSLSLSCTKRCWCSDRSLMAVGENGLPLSKDKIDKGRVGGSLKN